MKSSGRAGNHIQSGSIRVFIPDPLPPDPPVDLYDPELVSLESKAALALGRLEGLAEIIPNPDHFISMYVRKEALLSSQIEGTQASLIDLLESESQERSEVRGEVLEVRNCISALEMGLELAKVQLPFSLRLLKEVHKRLLEGVRGGTPNPGEFRSVQNWIGAPGASIADAEFIPPPVDHMAVALSDLEKYYHGGSDYSPLIRCGLLHAQFETIHPFLDGNGRIGRLLITFFLCDVGVLSRPLLYLSYYFKKKRTDYYDCLMAVRNEGDWERWLKFFLTGVIEVASSSVDTAKRIIALQQEDTQRIEQGTSSVNGPALLRLLLKTPSITAKRVAEELKVTSATAHGVIKRLEALGILVERTGQMRNKRWAYARLIEILSEGTTPLS